MRLFLLIHDMTPKIPSNDGSDTNSRRRQIMHVPPDVLFFMTPNPSLIYSKILQDTMLQIIIKFRYFLQHFGNRCAYAYRIACLSLSLFFFGGVGGRVRSWKTLAFPDLPLLYPPCCPAGLRGSHSSRVPLSCWRDIISASLQRMILLLIS